MNRWLFGPALGLVAVVALAVSACGSAGTSTAEPAEPSSSPAAPAGPPGASGTVAAVTASHLQVQNPRTGQVTVSFTPSTSFTRTVSATAADLVVGDCALALGAPQPAGAPVTATSVLISPATADGGCPGGGGRSRGATASGKITSVSGGGFVMQVGNSNATRTVTTTQSSTFTKTIATDHSALAVGECVTALGPSDDTGAVAASMISIRQPDPNGCQGGFGGPGRGRGPARTGPGAADTGSNGGLNGA